MENNEYTLPTLDLNKDYMNPEEVFESERERLGLQTEDSSTSEKPKPELHEEKDNRPLKEKIKSAAKNELDILKEDIKHDKEAFKNWREKKKGDNAVLQAKLKKKIKAIPEKTKELVRSLPQRTKAAAKKLYEKAKNFKFTKKTAKSLFVYSALAAWALIVLFPFYWMILTSFKSYGSYNQETIPQFIVKNPTIENYITAFKAVPLAQYFLNTLIFTLLTTAFMLIVTVLAAYGFARINFRGKNLMFTLFLSLMMIPAELVIITNFVTITNWDMRNSFEGLILPSVTSVFYIYLLKENFQQVPNELYYAAKIDGTTDFKYLLKVMLPICKPTLVTVTILKVIECWNSYVWPRLITDDEKYYLVSNGIQAIREGGFGRENIPAMMAAVVVISIPLILLFLIFRNKIMEGVARGGTKG